MNNTTVQFNLPPDNKQLQLSVFIISFVCGIVGNFVVVWVIAITKQKTVSDLLVSSLAVSDILFLSLNIPVNIHKHVHRLVFNNFFCKVILPMITMTFFLSVFTLTAMAVHRCIGILNPFGKKLSPRQALIVIFVIWIMAFVPVVPLIIVSEADPAHSTCYEIWKQQDRKYYTLALFLLQYLLPLLVISIAYYKIARYLYGSKVPRIFVNEIGAIRRRMSREENKPVLRTLAAIVLAYALCLLPHQICGFLWDFGGRKEKQAVLYMVSYTHMLVNIHSCLNPFIYGTLTKHFRNRFAKYICQICRPFKQKKQKPRYFTSHDSRVRLMRGYNQDSFDTRATVSSSALCRSNTQSSTVTRTMESPGHSPSHSPHLDKIKLIPNKGAKFRKSKEAFSHNEKTFQSETRS